MMDDEALRAVLRAALPDGSAAPARDLWPDVVGRLDARRRWSAVDLTLAAVTAVGLLLFPEGAWLMAFHL